MNLPGTKVKKQPRVIFMDAAGTLIHPAKPVGWQYARVAQAFGADTDEARMEAAFRECWKKLPDRPPSPIAREGDDRPWWEALATKVLYKAATVPRDFETTAWFDALYRVYAEPGAWAIYDDVRPALERLHGRVRLAVISNFDGRLRGILEGHGLAFEHVIISSEVGCEKPAAAIFEHALRTMKAEPEDCWHVGDDPRRDWAGAEAAGIHAFPLRRPEAGLLQLASECGKVLEA